MICKRVIEVYALRCIMLWCNGPVEGGTLGLRIDDVTSGRNVDDDVLSSDWPVDAALLVG